MWVVGRGGVTIEGVTISFMWVVGRGGLRSRHAPDGDILLAAIEATDNGYLPQGQTEDGTEVFAEFGIRLAVNRWTGDTNLEAVAMYSDDFRGGGTRLDMNAQDVTWRVWLQMGFQQVKRGLGVGRLFPACGHIIKEAVQQVPNATGSSGGGVGLLHIGS